MAATAWFAQGLPDRSTAKTKVIVVGLLGVLLVLGLGWAFAVDLPKEKKADPPAAPVTSAAVTAPEAKKLDPGTARRTREPINREPLTPSAGKVMLYFGALVSGVVLAAWITKKLLAKSRMLPNGSRVLKLVDAIPLGPRRQVFVLNAYGRRLIVGAAGDQMTLLSEFAADEADAGPAAPFEKRLDEAAAVEAAGAGTNR